MCDISLKIILNLYFIVCVCHNFVLRDYYLLCDIPRKKNHQTIC